MIFCLLPIFALLMIELILLQVESSASILLSNDLVLVMVCLSVHIPFLVLHLLRKSCADFFETFLGFPPNGPFVHLSFCLELVNKYAVASHLNWLAILGFFQSSPICLVAHLHYGSD